MLPGSECKKKRMQKRMHAKPPKQKAFITLCSPVVPLLSTSKADSGLASEFRWDRAIYTAYERMLKVRLRRQPLEWNKLKHEGRQKRSVAMAGSGVLEQSTGAAEAEET